LPGFGDVEPDEPAEPEELEVEPDEPPELEAPLEDPPEAVAPVDGAVDLLSDAGVAPDLSDFVSALDASAAVGAPAADPADPVLSDSAAFL
jgi:hypothetical protein